MEPARLTITVSGPPGDHPEDIGDAVRSLRNALADLADVEVEPLRLPPSLRPARAGAVESYVGLAVVLAGMSIRTIVPSIAACLAAWQESHKHLEVEAELEDGRRITVRGMSGRESERVIRAVQTSGPTDELVESGPAVDG
jgi:hypothetical protein